MTESSFASLSPTLLARKGGAKPAMRRQIAPLHGESGNGGVDLASDLEDLGWNDMGENHDEPAQPTGGLVGLTPEPVAPQSTPINKEMPETKAVAPVSPAKQQIEELATRIASPGRHAPGKTAATKPAASKDESVSKPRRSALAHGRRAAFTLRLDSDRHLKLRLASTVRGRSAQSLMTEALDRMLGDMPEIDKMAAQAAGQ